MRGIGRGVVDLQCQAHITRVGGVRGGGGYVLRQPQHGLAAVTFVEVLRRFGAGIRVSVLLHGNVELDLEAHAVYLLHDEKRSSVTLTLSEFRILAHMIRAPSRAFSRSDLLDVCLPDSDALERTVDSHISNLRKKLEAAGSGPILAGVRGIGYRLAGDV